MENEQKKCAPAEKEPMIPKRRFDEVNVGYRETLKKTRTLEETLARKEAQVATLCAQIEEIKSGYEKAANLLRVKEIFVSGGLTEREYQDLVEIIARTNETDMCELASCITKLIKDKAVSRMFF